MDELHRLIEDHDAITEGITAEARESEPTWQDRWNACEVDDRRKADRNSVTLHVDLVNDGEVGRLRRAVADHETELAEVTHALRAANEAAAREARRAESYAAGEAIVHQQCRELREAVGCPEGVSLLSFLGAMQAEMIDLRRDAARADIRHEADAEDIRKAYLQRDGAESDRDAAKAQARDALGRVGSQQLEINGLKATIATVRNAVGIAPR